MLFVSPEAGADGNKCVLSVGIINFAKPVPNEPIVEKTIETLREHLPACKIEVKHLEITKLKKAIEDGKVDFFLSSAGFYREMQSQGARDLASVISSRHPNPNNTDATALVVLNNSPFNKLKDLKGKRVVALSKYAFPGYLIAMGEIAKKGYDPETFFSKTIEVGSEDLPAKALAKLREGKADVAFIKHCLLEFYLEAHPGEKGLYRVLEQKQQPGQCLRSTSLYPGWTFASTSQASPSLSRKVTSIILDMPPDANGRYWSVSTDYGGVDDLFKELKYGPYSYLKERTVKSFIKQHPTALSLLFLTILGLIFHSLRSSHVVKKKTKELREALKTQQKLKSEASAMSERINSLQKLGIVNQLSSMMFHEIRQPLVSSNFYIEGLKTLATKGELNTEILSSVIVELEKQNARIDQIIQTVRSYIKKGNEQREVLDVSALTKTVAESFLKSKSNRFDLKLKIEPNLRVSGIAVEFEIMLLNLLNNAWEAQSQNKKKKVIVSAHQETDRIIIEVSDFAEKSQGSVLSGKVRAFQTSKEEGLGLGLVIVKGILEKLRGTLSFKENKPCGVTAVLDIPAAKETEKCV